MRDIDQVIAILRERLPQVKCEQLGVRHPGTDDDGIWFLELAPGGPEVQVESPTGMCPFLVESTATDDRIAGPSVQETAEAVESILRRFGGS